MIELLDNLIKKIRDYGIESVFKRYYSVYRAQVTSNEDETGRGLIEVKVPNLFGDKPLPSKAEPRDFRGAGPSKGEFYPPEVGDWVYVEFEMGDPKFPIYSGGWYGTGEVSSEFAYTANKPTSRGMVNKYGHVLKFVEVPGKEQFVLTSPAGHFLVLDDTKDAEAMYFIHKSGAQIQLDKDGAVKLLAKDGTFFSLDATGGGTTLASKTGAYVSVKEDGVTVQDPSGKTFITVTEKGITLNSSADAIIQAGTATVEAGSVVLNGSQAKLALGNAKFAIGTKATELVDQIIQALDALLNAPTLVTTGTGPSSPLMPPAKIQLTLIKTLLTAVKGTVP